MKSSALNSLQFRYGNLSIDLKAACDTPSKCPNVSTPDCATPSKCPNVSTPDCVTPSKCPNVSTPNCVTPSKCPNMTTPAKRAQVRASDLLLLQEQLGAELQQL
ncbi:MAG TPA: hypothetical protein VGP80_06375 [Gemmatimonadales bacterium]|nr:hypothetical protein [Gemmatimonadales bacterium]